MKVSEERIRRALSHIIDPDLKQDIVTAGLVAGLAWNEENQKVSISLQLTTPACPLKSYFESQVRRVLQEELGEAWSVEIAFTAQTIGGSFSELPQVKNVLLVASGKGGVGKSTLSVNLAVCLAKRGAKVGLLDADIYGPSVPILMGLERAKPSVEEKESRPYLLPIYKYGVYVMSMGFLVPTGQATPWRGPMASNTLRQLLTDTLWPELDYLIVDMPPGTGDIQITMAQQFRPQGAIIITTPQKVALADAEKALSMFKMPLIQVPIIGIVENMSYFWTPLLPERKFYIFGEKGGRMLAEKYEVPFLGEIPLIEDVVQEGDRGIPSALSEGTPMSEAFSRVADEVVREVARLAFFSSVVCR
ncbi:MAG: P-loop NTPase [Bacteroidia bacterium]|nr:Mrp/NBP35 family ATP-binding protein [Bacteroidia bacterium]MDW8133445.1 P-loop NTPase [Bacteroidia bacterium]